MSLILLPSPSLFPAVSVKLPLQQREVVHSIYHHILNSSIAVCLELTGPSGKQHYQLQYRSIYCSFTFSLRDPLIPKVT